MPWLTVVCETKWSRPFAPFRFANYSKEHFFFSDHAVYELITRKLLNRESTILVEPETHKGLKRVTRVQCSWIFTFTIFGNRSVLNTDCGLWTTDCGLGIKYGLGIKRGLRTEYKTRTGYKTRTTDNVNKNSFRKVKLREMESGLAKTVVPALTFPWLFT